MNFLVHKKYQRILFFENKHKQIKIPLVLKVFIKKKAFPTHL
jgi:hypothetical protein